MAIIIIPRNPQKVLELAQKIVDKHNVDGETSPLSLVITEETQQIITEGKQLDTQTDELEKQKEIATKARDAKVKEAVKMVKRSRDLLKGVYSDNLRILGDYGFTVND